MNPIDEIVDRLEREKKSDGPWWENPEAIQKLASSGASFEQVEAVIKEAAHQKQMQDVYADFDSAGRIMAHGYYDELMKIAKAHLEETQTALNNPDLPIEEKRKLAALNAILHGK
jgi:hypothetical protein